MAIKKVQKIEVETRRGKYKVLFRWDKKDRAYIVKVPGLPEVFTFGKNLKEAKYMAKDAIELYCDSLIGEGKIIIDDEGSAFGKLPQPRIIKIAGR